MEVLVMKKFVIFLSYLFSLANCVYAMENTQSAFEKYPQHFEKIKEVFKKRKNLRMVLGAGCKPEDYTDRFTNYDFLVTTSPSEFLINEKIYAGNNDEIFQGPILVPLNFNSDDFWKWINDFKGSFREIIFDLGVMQYIRWRVEELEKIYDALANGGTLYMDAQFFVGGSVYFQHNKHEKPEFISFEQIDDKEYVNYNISTENYKFLLLQYVNFITKNLVPGQNTYVNENEVARPGYHVVSMPTKEFALNWFFNMLKNAGFDVEYKEQQPYPSCENKWIPARKETFEALNFFYAKK